MRNGRPAVKCMRGPGDFTRAFTRSTRHTGSIGSSVGGGVTSPGGGVSVVGGAPGAPEPEVPEVPAPPLQPAMITASVRRAFDMAANDDRCPRVTPRELSSHARE